MQKVDQDAGALVAALCAFVDVQPVVAQEPEAATPPPAVEPWKIFLPLDDAEPAP